MTTPPTAPRRTTAAGPTTPLCFATGGAGPAAHDQGFNQHTAGATTIRPHNSNQPWRSTAPPLRAVEYALPIRTSAAQPARQAPVSSAVRAPGGPCILHATPSLRSFVWFGGVAAHPPHMLAPSIPGGCATLPSARNPSLTLCLSGPIVRYAHTQVDPTTVRPAGVAEAIINKKAKGKLSCQST